MQGDAARLMNCTVAASYSPHSTRLLTQIHKTIEMTAPILNLILTLTVSAHECIQRLHLSHCRVWHFLSSSPTARSLWGSVNQHHTERQRQVLSRKAALFPASSPTRSYTRRQVTFQNLKMAIQQDCCWDLASKGLEPEADVSSNRPGSEWSY